MKVLFFAYGVVSYVAFLASFLYAIGFCGNFLVPKSMDSGPTSPFGVALAINLSVLAVFAIQHSVMARQGFKKAWTRIVPAPIERSTYVLFSSLALILIFVAWQPMGLVIWDVSGTAMEPVLWGLCAFGWITVLISTFLIDHFHLFGLKQVYYHLKGKEIPPPTFKTPALYKFVRHPIYFGFTIAFWATPVMTLAHLLFAVMTLGYVLVGIFFEEKDLVSVFGAVYEKYQRLVSMLIPWMPKKG